MGRVVAECAESCMSYHDGQGVQVSFCKRLMGKAAVWDLCICRCFWHFISVVRMGRLPLKREEGYSWCVLGWSLLLVALDEIFIVGVAEVNLLHEIACLACAV